MYIYSSWVNAFCSLRSSTGLVELRAVLLRPERWWTLLGHGEARWKLGGSLRCAELTCKSLPPDLSKGAKDSSNHLVAGSLRSFPQDSSNPLWVARGKAMKGGICGSSLHDLGLLSNFKSLRLVNLSLAKIANLIFYLSFICFHFVVFSLLWTTFF